MHIFFAEVNQVKSSEFAGQLHHKARLSHKSATGIEPTVKRLRQNIDIYAVQVLPP